MVLPAVNVHNVETRNIACNAVTGCGFLVDSWKKEKNFSTTPVATNAPSHYAYVLSFAATGLHKSSISSSSYCHGMAVIGIPPLCPKGVSCNNLDFPHSLPKVLAVILISPTLSQRC
jgi:hypothetical protein